jgi:hypothetical protein
MREFKTDPSKHVHGMTTVNIENRTEDTERRIADSTIVVCDGEPDRGLMECGGNSLVSTDPKAIKEFAALDFATMGMRFMYAVNHETRQVVRLVKTGNKFAQRDVKPLIAKGFTEWSLPYMAPKHWRFTDGEIVKLSGEVDCSPVETTRKALAFHGLI